MPDMIEKKFEELGSTFEQFKKNNDEQMKTLVSKGSVDTLLKEQGEKLNAEITKLQTEIKGMQTAMARTEREGGNGGEKGLTEDQQKYSKGFNRFMRKGSEEGLRELQTKALSVDSDPDGGYLVPTEVSARIVKKIYETVAFRGLATVETIGTDKLEINNDTDESDCGWVGERESRDDTDTPQVGQIEIPVHEIYAQPKATQKFLDDAAVNAEAWLAGKVSEKFSRFEADAFINGNGVKKPKGILAYTAGTSYSLGEIEQVNLGSISQPQANNLIDLNYALKSAYAKNATWLMRRATVASIRKLVDLNGMYLWQPGLQAGQPDLLLGRPIMEGDEMPAIASAALSIAFGDFKAAYTIVDRIGIRVLRDPFTAKPYVRFYTTKRVGGGVVDFEAIKIGKMSV